MKQSSKAAGWREILTFVEGPGRIKPGTTAESLEQEFDDRDLNNVSNTVPGDWRKLPDELESVLFAKSGDKSEAFMLTKRASNGILAWALINNWYMATSGLGICQRRAAIMSPVQSKSDSEVMYDVERWLDEVRELMALGQPDLPPMYKITGLKQIATQKIIDQIEFQEQRLIGTAPEKMWEELKDFTLNWSRYWMLDQRAPTAPDPNKMDTNNVSQSSPTQWGPPGISMGGGSNHSWQQEWQAQMIATMKGKGKGPANGKGFGPWKGGKGSFGNGFGGGKGKGKGMEFQNPYRGYCANCHLIGHSSNYCPYLGKGFKGTCKGCGIIGHKQALCPRAIARRRTEPWPE